MAKRRGFASQSIKNETIYKNLVRIKLNRFKLVVIKIYKSQVLNK